MSDEEQDILKNLDTLVGKTISSIENVRFRLFDPDLKSFRINFTDGSYLDLAADMVDYDVCALCIGGLDV